MKYRANITNLLHYSNSTMEAIKHIRECGYNIVSDKYSIYIEADSIEAADLIECLNFNI